MYAFSAVEPPGVDVNRALGRETWQSGVELDRNSSIAVDGNYDPTGTLCTYTPQVSYPWWAVDLGTWLEVYKVVVMAIGGW